MNPASFLLFALLPALALAQPSRYELPACTGSHLELADRVFYILCYDAGHKVPLWTAHEINPDLPHVAVARPRHFRHDTALSGAIARNADYLHSGFSRGHLVPAEDMAWSDEALRSTFLLSNTIPQNQSVNAGPWKRIESAVRSAASAADAAYVFSGPIFDAAAVAHIGPGHVAVPTHIFKVVLILSGERKTMFAAIVPNTSIGDEPLTSFLTTVDEVERKTGLDFFSGLDDEEENRLESGLPATVFGLKHRSPILF